MVENALIGVFTGKAVQQADGLLKGVNVARSGVESPVQIVGLEGMSPQAAMLNERRLFVVMLKMDRSTNGQGASPSVAESKQKMSRSRKGCLRWKPAHRSCSWTYEIRKFTNPSQVHDPWNSFGFKALANGGRVAMWDIGNRSWVEGEANPMLKILRSTKDESVILTLIGRIEGECLEELKRLVWPEASGHNLVLDMKDVTLVDQSAVRFLARCEADSVTLENCPAYIRDWIAAEKRRNKRRKP